MTLIYLSGQGLVGVGVVHAGGGDVVDLLARAGCGLGDFDEVQDLGTAEAGDLHGTARMQGRLCASAARMSRHGQVALAGRPSLWSAEEPSGAADGYPALDSGCVLVEEQPVGEF